MGVFDMDVFTRELDFPANGYIERVLGKFSGVGSNMPLRNPLVLILIRRKKDG